MKPKNTKAKNILIAICSVVTTIVVLYFLGLLNIAAKKDIFEANVFYKPLSIPIEKDSLSKAEWKSKGFADSISGKWKDLVGKDKNGYKDRKKIKSSEATIQNIPFTTYLVQYHATDDYGVAATNNKLSSSSSCMDYYNSIKELYGQPHNEANVSSDSLKDISASWDLGNSRVSYSCVSFTLTTETMGVAYIEYGDKSDVEEIKDPIYLTCTSKLYNEYNGKNEENQPMDILINPNTEKLTSDHRIGDTTEYSEEKIVNHFKDNDYENDFVLNRNTGSYTWNIKAKNLNSPIKVWGNCTKVDKNKKI